LHAERRHIAELGVDYSVQIGVDLALFRIGAGHFNAVAIRRRRRTPDKMVVFVGGEDEQRIVFSNAVLLQPIEKFPESVIICGELLYVAALAGAEGAALTRKVIVVRVGDIAVDHRHPCPSWVAR
jgi:hypothetical protein